MNFVFKMWSNVSYDSATKSAKIYFGKKNSKIWKYIPQIDNWVLEIENTLLKDVSKTLSFLEKNLIEIQFFDFFIDLGSLVKCVGSPIFGFWGSLVNPLGSPIIRFWGSPVNPLGSPIKKGGVTSGGHQKKNHALKCLENEKLTLLNQNLVH